MFYWDAENLDTQRTASDLINRYGLNAVEMIFGLLYIRILQQTDQLKTTAIPDCPLDFRKYAMTALRLTNQVPESRASGLSHNMLETPGILELRELVCPEKTASQVVLRAYVLNQTQAIIAFLDHQEHGRTR